MNGKCLTLYKSLIYVWIFFVITVDYIMLIDLHHKSQNEDNEILLGKYQLLESWAT